MPKSKVPANFQAPKVVNPGGFIFENARGGPYKYGAPLPCNAITLRAKEEGLL